MLTLKERCYLERRAAEERRAALRAPGLAAKAAHLKMARHYELQIEVEEGLTPRDRPAETGETNACEILPPNTPL
jgi:hypothetical protein